MRIAMWSGPRNLSTAMMYSFAARGDCAVSDEPFYAAYLAARLVIHSAYVTIPRLFNPFVEQTRIPTTDIFKVDVEPRTSMLGLRAIVVHTHLWNYRIYPAFVRSNWARSRVPEEELISALKAVKHGMPGLFRALAGHEVAAGLRRRPWPCHMSLVRPDAGVDDHVSPECRRPT